MVAGISAGIPAGAHVGVISMTALRSAQADGGDVVMPVRPAQLINTNFRHITLMPESRLENGVPLYKLRILDTLIDQLSRKSQVPSVDAASIDTIIGEMSRGLRGGGSGRPYRAGFLPVPGAFVDLVA
jgi:hypothetical protein